MLPHERLHWCFYVVLNALFKATFIDLFGEKFTYGFDYLCALIVGFAFICGVAYAALNYDIDVASNAIAFVFLSIQILVKYLCVHHLRSMVNVADCMINIYKYNSADARKDLLLERYARISKNILKSIMIFYGICTSVYLFHPIAVYLLHNELMTPLPAYYPGINETNPYIFTALVIYNIPIILISNIFHCAFHAIITIIFVNMLMMAGIFGMHVSTVNEQLELSDNDPLKLKRQFIHLIREHRQFSM